ncbi:phage tail tape measure protein [Streptomyces sp. AK08-02]|uniref:phage tail tape measure protein n=1 Tax=Streptomyces sp. AK08-02 TaxID=3028654 RepID=UPI0029BAC396|nr:phage tail tape measure protein [Streptomyces sp. AK08-02]MDX3746699.1 phage tail tape measure protein [Streptomyces sp. AK08-02]
MTTRTVNVRLIADINQYTRNMRNAARQTSQMAKAGAIAGTALVTAFAVAAAAAAKFDKELSNVRAVTGASAKEMGKLRAAALEAGKTTSFTATEAARAEAELARAGVTTADIIGGALKGSLALAASGQVDLTEAAVVSAQAMNTFGLAGKDVTHIADLLAAGANKSAADVHGLAMSLRMGGLLAHQTGLSIEDTVGTLAAFADHALIGSDAGTSLKVMLQRLVPQSKEAKGTMDAIGFSAYDASGKFVGLSELAGRMKTSFSKLTPEARNAAMATIFGADAVRSATILYELGSEGINKYVKSVNDQGAAGRMASIQTDNLIGDVERLRGAIEVALIESGSAANGTLRQMTKWITSLINAYNGLSPELQHAVTLFTGVGGAMALAGAGILLLLPRIAATRAAMTAMGITAARTRIVMMRLGQVGAVVAGLELISFAAQKIHDQFKDAPASVSKMANSFVDLAQKGKAGGEAARVFGENLDGFGKAVQRVAHPSGENRATDIVNSLTLGLTEGLMESDIALQDARDQVKSVDEALSGLVQGGAADTAADAFTKLATEAAAQGTSTEKLLTLLPGYSDALASTDTQSKLTAEAQAKLATQAGMTADELQDQRTEAEKLSDALKNLNGGAISAAESEIAFRQSLKSLSDAVKDNGHSLDVTTEKGQAVKGAFLDAAKAAMENANAVAEQKGSQEAGQKVLTKDIRLLKEQMSALGFSKDAIDRLTGAYLRLPPVVPTKVEAKTAAAMRDLEAVKRKIASTKGRSFTMSALDKDARATLERLGFKIKNLKGKKVMITVPTGAQKTAVDALAAAIRALQDKSVAVTTTFYTRGTKSKVAPAHRDYGAQADGSILSFYADGGVRENHVAQIARKGSWRVWAEDEAGDEAYIPLAANKRPRSRQIAAETVKRLGGSVQWFAGGGIPGFTYTPTGRPVLGGPSDAKSRYDQEIEDLKKAWADLTKALADARKKTDALKDAERNLARVRRSKPTKKQLEAAQDRVADARKAKGTADARVRQERADVYAADAELGLKKGAKAPRGFNLKAYQTQLNESVAETEKWRKSLSRIGQRGGKELQALLEGMGEDGYALVNALAGASDKQFKDIVAKLEKTGDFAKATLKDFTSQLGSSTKESQKFAADLQKLAAAGFGDLAQALAAQGDASAMTLASEAVGNSKAAAAANAQVGKAQSTLTGEDLANSLVLLSTLRGGPGRGYADLIAAGLDTATIKALVPKMTKQIGSLPAPNKETFVRQWVAQGGKAMAAGGILNRPAMVLGGEAGVRESWIPWNGSARSRALLAKTAAAMGYQMVPAGRYGGGGVSTAAVAREVSRQITVNLYGARQSSAEQAHDIARVISFTG